MPDRPTTPSKVLRVLALAVLGAAVLAACGADGDPATPSATGTLEGRVTVFAASSLTEAFEVIRVAFEDAHPGVEVEYSFGGSSALATQIEEGAPADVFASADEAQMQRLLAADRVRSASVFAGNALVIVTPEDNPARIDGPVDLARPGVKLVLAQPDVPVGAYSRQALEALGRLEGYPPSFARDALANLVSNEPNVRGVLTKVQLGEADAGVVYVTDAMVAGTEVRRIDFPEGVAPVARYPIAVTTRASNPAAAEAFVEFVRSPEGQRILADAGFGPPS